MKQTLPILTILISLIVSWGAALSPAQQPERARAASQQLFRIRGIQFTKEQQVKVDELRRRYGTRLAELQRERNAVHTPQQRQARRAALEAGKKSGKRAAELQQAVDKAVSLSDAQTKQLADIQTRRGKLVAEIQTAVRGLLTAEQRSTAQRGAGRSRQAAIAPTHRNLQYGKHERNVMDIWLAKSDKPTPVLVSIHGGGFRGGNKSIDRNLLRQSLDSGISVVAITYRLSGQAIAPAQHHDAARAIQFIRHNASRWNLDPSRIAATGGSAGAGLSLWLGFHQDLADKKNKDPVLRQSTRLTCMSVYNGQTSYDPRFIRKLFPGTNTYQHAALSQLFDVNLKQLDQASPDKLKLFEYVSALPHLTKGDPPAQLTYASTMETPITNQSIGIHHPRFAQALKEKMEPLNIACEIHTGVRRGSDQWTKLTLGFIKKQFEMAGDQ